ncbi:MAG: sugar phosphate isomerase/epimerase [Clostridia bacterium]|nr:sugar phosphate isomerase/epimerase [Clostridia bacterium]
MKLGISMNFAHKTPEEWAKKHKDAGLSAVVFPCGGDAPVSVIDNYVLACREYGLTIAEVGAWSNILSPDEKTREENFAYCLKQLELSEYIGAKCCVNISGAKGEVWDGGYKDNYSEKTYAEIIESVRKLIDKIKPKKTFYTLEPMPWMHPWSPEDYLKMIKDIDRDAFAVHLDVVNMLSSPERYFDNARFTNGAIALLGKYTKSCHVKDVLLDTHLTVILKETPCGKGGFDIKNYLERLDELDPDMPVIIEHLENEDEYREAIRYIKSL